MLLAHYLQNGRRTSSLHGCIKTRRVEGDEAKNEGNSPSEADLITRSSLDKLRRDCGFSGQANDNADTAGHNESTPTKSINEQAVEQIPRHSHKIEKAQEQQRHTASDSETREQYRVVIVDHERSGTLVPELNEKA